MCLTGALAPQSEHPSQARRSKRNMARPAPQSPSVAFLEQLKQFYFSNGLPFKDKGLVFPQTPVFSRQEMDLLLLWRAVQERGGSAKVCKAKHWAAVGRVFNPPKSMTNLSFHVKRIYARCLLDYERWLHPDLAMVDDVESSGPFSNKRFKDEHIFYGPTLVTKNKRQRAQGRTVSAHSGDIIADGHGTNSSINFQVRGSPQQYSSRNFGNLGTEASRIRTDNKYSAPWVEVETEQAAAMLWSLKRAEIKRLQGIEKAEKVSSAEVCAKAGGSEETSPEQVSYDCNGLDDSRGIATNCLEDWYQDKMKTAEEHEEDLESLKNELEGMRSLAQTYEVALEKTESAFQECRWCYNKLLEAIYPKHSDDRLLSKVTG